ncbi:hypothetical protein GCM10009569_20550 [Arthrobacter russicus]
MDPGGQVEHRVDPVEGFRPGDWAADITDHPLFDPGRQRSGRAYCGNDLVALGLKRRNNFASDESGGSGQ